MDDQAAIVREAQKTGVAAFRNFPHFGPSGFANALENVGEHIESRNQFFIPAARGLHFAVPRGAPSVCIQTARQSGPSIAFLFKPLKPSLCAVQHLCSYRHSICRLFSLAAWQHPSIKHQSAALQINQSTSTITSTEFIRCKAAGRIFLSGSLERFATSCQSRDISS